MYNNVTNQHKFDYATLALHNITVDAQYISKYAGTKNGTKMVLNGYKRADNVVGINMQKDSDILITSFYKAMMHQRTISIDIFL